MPYALLHSHAKLNKMGGENVPLNHISIRALSLPVHLALPNKNRKLPSNQQLRAEASFTNRSCGPDMRFMQGRSHWLWMYNGLKGATSDSNSYCIWNSLKFSTKLLFAKTY